MPEADATHKGSWKVAVTGKGGSGKTMVTAMMTGLLARSGELSLLAVDADSAVSLPYALGVPFHNTVSAIRRQIIEDPEARARMENKPMRSVMEGILAPGRGFHVLVMGRPEGPGCYCSINDLLRYGIEHLAQGFDMTIIDCEAGPEQVNRRVVRGVDLLMVVTDTSVRGLRVANSIAEVAQSDDELRPAHMGLVINRWKTGDGVVKEEAEPRGLELLGRIPDDESVTEYDAVGRPIIDLPDTTPSVMAVREIVARVVPEHLRGRIGLE